MPAAQRERQTCVAAGGRLEIDLRTALAQAHDRRRVPLRQDQRGIDLAASCLDDGLDVWRVGREHAERPRLDHARFFAGNGLERVAEILLMIEVDRRDGAGARIDGVGRVESSAESNLEQCHVHGRAPEQLQRGGGGHLEERRRRRQLSRGVLHTLDGGVERRGRHVCTIDREALFEVDQMRGREPARPVAGGAQALLERGGDRPLAVGAGNRDRGKRALRRLERAEQRPDLVETELDTDLFERIQERPGFRHGSDQMPTGESGTPSSAGGVAVTAGAGARRPVNMRSVLAIVCFSSRRSTMRSMKPFSSRNSLR